MTLDLTDDEAAALVAHLKHAIDYDRYPMTLLGAAPSGQARTGAEDDEHRPKSFRRFRTSG
jgi:hypothetical protein